MEQFTPLSEIEPNVSEETPEQSIGVSPLAGDLFSFAIATATDFIQKAIEPEQVRQRSTKNQEELLSALKTRMLEQELAFLEAQHPSHVFTRIFDGETQTATDAQNLAAVRDELAHMTQPAKPISMEPQDFVMQQAMHIKSSIGISEAPIGDIPSGATQQDSTQV